MKLIIKVSFGIFFLLLNMAVNAQEENIEKNTKRNEAGYFLVVQKGDNNNRIQHIFEGDKIKLHTQKGEKYRGIITGISKYQITLDSSNNIVRDEIITLKKIEPELAHILVGAAMIIGGGTLFVPVLAGSVPIGWMAVQGGIGSGLIAGGLMIIIPPKYHLNEDDQLFLRKLNESENRFKIK